MLAARITLPHFSVSPAISLPKSAGEPGSTVPPMSAKPRFHPGINETRVNFLVEFIDDLGGSVPGRTDAIPLARFVSRQKIPHSGKLRKHLHPRRGGHGKCA